MAILVDTNVIIDVLTDDPDWADWSEDTLAAYSPEDLAINPAIYAELSFGCREISEVEAIVREFGFSFVDTPRRGLFRAAKAFERYKKSGGRKHFVLPDFFIGGHADASGIKVITRDISRYRSYFPGVTLIAP